jgi:DNA integrity scanning protein DisA with diadenylate cyclase activity
MRDYRAVRKLLEMSSEEMCLLSDSGYVYGLGQLRGLYDQRAEDLFLINFTKHYTWELVHAGHTLMRVVYGQPELPRTPINKEKFERDIHRIFHQVGSKQVARLWDLITEAIKQKHGTMVVVSTGAQTEAERLKTQSTTIEPIRLTSRTMQMATAIDGAVLIDPDSICYAVGVILDGLASRKGTPSRGARYNSAIRYVESSKYPCVAIVVSEDGTIDLVPDLMPQVRRSEILEAIEQLRELKEKDKFDLKTFNRTMSWLSEHQFYLLPQMCEEINELRREVEATRDLLIEPSAVRLSHSDFVPNEEMNESYYLEESV